MRSQVKPLTRFVRKPKNRPDFSKVKDPRKRRGRRWALHALLNAVFLGMLAFERNLRGVEKLTRDLEGCRRLLDIARRVPDSTLARLLGLLRDEEGLRQAHIRLLRDAERRKALEPTRLCISMVAIDGKTIWSGEHPIKDPACQKSTQDGRTFYRLHALHAALVSAQSQPCLDQMLVRGKTNEMASYIPFLKRLKKTYGRSHLRLELISTDAGMTSAKNAKFAAREDFAYLMGVKANQPTLLAEAQRLCGQGEHKQVNYVCEATTHDHYRGKHIRRDLYRSRDIEGWPQWESARQFWRVKQTTTDKDGKVTVENRYFITNLVWGRLTAHQVLAVVRAHWGVENGCHWTVDVVMKEDDCCWCTTGKALRMLSWIRLMAYNVVRLLKDRHLRSDACRSMDWDDMRRLLHKALTDGRAWMMTASDEAAFATA
jgi:predicted transposase YbfD/YdcC